MGIIFSDKAKRVQIKDLLNDPVGRIILGRLQAGREGDGDPMGFGTSPRRLSQEELELLKDEWIYYEDNGDCWYARFEKPANEIRAILGLEPQDMFGRPIKKDESVEESMARNPLDLYFEDVNVYGETLTESANYITSYKGFAIYKDEDGDRPYWCQRGYTDQCWDASFASLSELKDYIDKYGNDYEESLHEAKEEICCICGEPIDGYGNNPEPFKHEGRCCDACNMKFVIPARMAQINNEEE